jgi:hypothetical protein
MLGYQVNFKTKADQTIASGIWDGGPMPKTHSHSSMTMPQRKMALAPLASRQSVISIQITTW